MAEKAIKFRLFLDGISVKAREYRLNYKYQIYAEEHPIKAYKYDIYKVQNNVCPHSTFKCVNYGENHRANSPKYKIIKKITKKYLKESSSD